MFATYLAPALLAVVLAHGGGAVQRTLLACALQVVVLADDAALAALLALRLLPAVCADVVPALAAGLALLAVVFLAMVSAYALGHFTWALLALLPDAAMAAYPLATALLFREVVWAQGVGGVASANLADVLLALVHAQQGGPVPKHSGLAKHERPRGWARLQE